MPSSRPWPLAASTQPTAQPPGGLLRTLGLLYALVAFVAALALFLYAIPFLSNLRYLKRAIVYPDHRPRPNYPCALGDPGRCAA